MALFTPLTAKLLKTTDQFIHALETMDIKTVNDLIHYFPRDHEDLRSVVTLMKAPLNEKVTLRGMIDKLKLIRTRSRKQIVQAQFIDEEGHSAKVVWFNQPHIMRMVKDRDEVMLTGKVQESGYALQINSPVFETTAKKTLVHGAKIVPVYPQNDMISTRWLREKMPLIASAISQIGETLPTDVIEESGIMKRADAIRELHFPSSTEHLKKAKERFAFEELYLIQRAALERKKQWQQGTQSRLKTPMHIELIKAFFASLSFTPTDSQRVAIYEILRDMESDTPMSRLLEGDVGSGKTLVAMAVMANTIQNGGQCALMVPTEVLARQHAENITRLFIGFHKHCVEKKSIHVRMPSIALLTGSTVRSEADQIKRNLASGTIDIVIGTHSLIEETVQFKDLRLAIVDEQHRFGVMQRARLREKGSPHFLSMTATPIPRTLALTAYGDHDLSVLLEKPGNRKVIKTSVVPPNERRTIELFIDNQISEGRQAFVICPLISESTSDEMAEVKSVQAEEKRLKEGFLRRRIATLHGKMVPKEKDDIMKRFKAKEFDILVSTSVIEVGIDVPNSTIIVIEGSERFGLAQLHQFRGRVGRSDVQSYCFLFTTTPEQARSKRLKAMEDHDSGFMLAEIDLQLRGPGELYGLRQSGIPEMRFGSILNPEMVMKARKAAELVLSKQVDRKKEKRVTNALRN